MAKVAEQNSGMESNPYQSPLELSDRPRGTLRQARLRLLCVSLALMIAYHVVMYLALPALGVKFIYVMAITAVGAFVFIRKLATSGLRGECVRVTAQGLGSSVLR